jgi:hypothetical protein
MAPSTRHSPCHSPRTKPCEFMATVIEIRWNSLGDEWRLSMTGPRRLMRSWSLGNDLTTSCVPLTIEYPVWTV